MKTATLPVAVNPVVFPAPDMGVAALFETRAVLGGQYGADAAWLHCRKCSYATYVPLDRCTGSVLPDAMMRLRSHVCRHEEEA